MTDRCIYYKAGYKYQITRDMHYQTTILGYDIDIEYIRLTPDGLLTLKKGYAWNGASGPTWDTKNSQRGSGEHDAGYQLIRLGYLPRETKEYFDQLLYDLCVQDGMFKFRAAYWKWAVIHFGIGSTRPSAEPQELVAP